MVTTITEPTGDDLTKLIYQKRIKANASIYLKDDTKYALCLLELAPAVTQGDYGTLGTAVKAIAGINDITLVIDHQTKASVPADHTQVAQIRADVTLRDDTPPPSGV